MTSGQRPAVYLNRLAVLAAREQRKHEPRCRCRGLGRVVVEDGDRVTSAPCERQHIASGKRKLKWRVTPSGTWRRNPSLFRAVAR